MPQTPEQQYEHNSENLRANIHALRVFCDEHIDRSAHVQNEISEDVMTSDTYTHGNNLPPEHTYRFAVEDLDPNTPVILEQVGLQAGEYQDIRRSDHGIVVLSRGSFRVPLDYPLPHPYKIYFAGFPFRNIPMGILKPDCVYRTRYTFLISELDGSIKRLQQGTERGIIKRTIAWYKKEEGASVYTYKDADGKLESFVDSPEEVTMLLQFLQTAHDVPSNAIQTILRHRVDGRERVYDRDAFLQWYQQKIKQLFALYESKKQPALPIEAFPYFFYNYIGQFIPDHVPVSDLSWLHVSYGKIHGSRLRMVKNAFEAISQTLLQYQEQISTVEGWRRSIQSDIVQDLLEDWENASFFYNHSRNHLFATMEALSGRKPIGKKYEIVI